jgi:flagellar biosynthesis/type III secretory pathway M-ring protein FliF/YscJ
MSSALPAAMRFTLSPPCLRGSDAMMIQKLLGLAICIVVIASAAALWVTYLIQLVKREEDTLEALREQQRKREERRRLKEDKKKKRSEEDEQYLEEARHLIADEQKEAAP